MPRILILTANSKTTPLQLANEVQGIRAAIGEHSNFTIQHETEVQGGDFIGLLTKLAPDILHFAGHGGEEQTITLRSGERGEAPLSSKYFARILQRLKVRPKLLVLNACSTIEFADKVMDYVSALVVTNRKIGDADARHFSSNFYTHLANSQSVAAAFELAQTSLDLAGYEGDSFELKPPTGADPENLVFYARPELMASFITSKEGEPEIIDGDYKMALWLRGVDQNIDSVTYQVCHEDFKGKEAFWEVVRSTSSSFYSNFSSFGDVNIRAVAWSKERGIGVEYSLVSAVERYYREAPSKLIAEAIQSLREH